MLPLIGQPELTISLQELEAHVINMAKSEVIDKGLKRVLLIPPDHTRLYSRAGQITAWFYRELTQAGITVAVMPALGTHFPMTPEQCDLLFGKDTIPYDAILPHRWREDLVTLGEISADEVSQLSSGRLQQSLPVQVNKIITEGNWDLAISPGQVVPHEVVGLANYTKNICIGLGGKDLIHRSHFLGAVCDMETMMGKVDTPVRTALNAAFDRFIEPHLRVLFVLTVMQDSANGVIQRGLFAGYGGSQDSGAQAFAEAGKLSAQVNFTRTPVALDCCACWLDPKEFHSTWLGNKAIYRTRMAMADGGTLYVLAPAVSTFGEDPQIDTLIRQHGYRGTPATLDAQKCDEALANNLSAAAHLIHGSSEGRFRIVYCTLPENGGLSQEDITGAGYDWMHLNDALQTLGITDQTADGTQATADNKPFYFIRNPALGLWAAPTTSDTQLS